MQHSKYTNEKHLNNTDGNIDTTNDKQNKGHKYNIRSKTAED